MIVKRVEIIDQPPYLSKWMKCSPNTKNKSRMLECYELYYVILCNMPMYRHM